MSIKQAKTAKREKLNLGAGDWHIDGYKSIDIDDVDLHVHPWPWKDNSIEAIYAGHILEHFDRGDGVKFLSECYRILRPEGALEIAVPDMDIFAECIITGDWGQVCGYQWKSLDRFMGGDESEINLLQRHRYMYCWASLAWTLKEIGFETVERISKRREIDNPAYAAISLHVLAVK